MMKYDWVDIMRYVKETRKLKLLSQYTLGKHLGFSDAAISNWEQGKCAPRVSSVYMPVMVLFVNSFPSTNLIKIYEDKLQNADVSKLIAEHLKTKEKITTLSFRSGISTMTINSFKSDDGVNYRNFLLLYTLYCMDNMEFQIKDLEEEADRIMDEWSIARGTYMVK